MARKITTRAAQAVLKDSDLFSEVLKITNIQPSSLQVSLNDRALKLSHFDIVTAIQKKTGMKIDQILVVE